LADDGSPIKPQAIHPDAEGAAPPLPGTAAPLLAADRKVLLAEVAAILCLAVVPHLVNALASGIGPEMPAQSLGISMLNLAVGSLQISAPILYILWRSGQPLASFGLQRPRWLFDAGAGILVVFLIWLTDSIGWWAASGFFGIPMLNVPSVEELFGTSRSAGDLVGLYVALPAVAFTEELAMRGYLMTRLRQLGAAPWLAVSISAVLFGAYHLYLGLWPAVLVTVSGVIFACVFLRLGRLWPVVFAHLLLDLLAFSQIPG